MREKPLGRGTYTETGCIGFSGTTGHRGRWGKLQGSCEEAAGRDSRHASAMLEKSSVVVVGLMGHVVIALDVPALAVDTVVWA